MRAREEQLTAFAYDTVHLQRLGAVIESGPGLPAHGRGDLGTVPRESSGCLTPYLSSQNHLHPPTPRLIHHLHSKAVPGVCDSEQKVSVSKYCIVSIRLAPDNATVDRGAKHSC